MFTGKLTTTVHPGVAVDHSPQIKIDQMTADLVQGTLETANTPSMCCQYFMEVRPNERSYQEDSCAMYTWCQTFKDNNSNNDETNPLMMFAVMDGHSDRGWYSSGEKYEGAMLGPLVADRMRDAFEKVLCEFPKSCFETQSEEVCKQLTDQATLVDESLLKEGLGASSGTTFSFALVTETHVVIGNSGDSHVCYDVLEGEEFDYLEFLRHPGVADTFNVEKMNKAIKNADEGYEMRPVMKKIMKESTDAFERKEMERVQRAGLEIRTRFVQTLAVTRSFGDFDHKSNPEVGGLENQGVIACPSMRILKRNTDKKEVLGLFTDGLIFNSKKNKHIQDDFLVPRALDDIYYEELLQKASSYIHFRAVEHGDGDNSGIILVKLHRDCHLKSKKNTEEKDETNQKRKHDDAQT
eukprot:CAMPEP_0118692518 /NCGR_PEP_ID=MMETSP0800-20121206/11336_1 /TAXON_ID=210618 ORGANISM="Striatella unipunctata, Strain CCMP2910" /NCGR_SAMPLE_ID=MMETSP0800 /ASSEMBLY_ACC=CAM_ASM_000638 /LENGTH=408 /DNA_ID=CAMNT_0006590529 /DNA_START=209 /DNA_END=1435 /DNA_ORIENTATION=+